MHNSGRDRLLNFGHFRNFWTSVILTLVIWHTVVYLINLYLHSRFRSNQKLSTDGRVGGHWDQLLTQRLI